MQHTPLDPATLSPDAQRALSSGPSKMMAARGMAPLANPVDLVSVLYQLCVEPDAKVQPAAQNSAKSLPQNILLGALGDAGLDARVIDYFVAKADCRSELIDTVILNRATADETISELAKLATEAQVELIAENQQRILRCTEIIAAVYTNPNARMSTVDRIVELAVRQQLKVPGIAAWDEIARGILQDAGAREAERPAPPVDDDFLTLEGDTQVDRPPGERAEEGFDEEEDGPRKESISEQIRRATIGNKFDRAELIKNSKKMVALAAIKSPMVKENEAASYASNTSLSEDVIAYIASRKEWTKLYQIKFALVNNPKCPLPVAMRLLPHLRPKDLSSLARSRGIPTALSAQARKLSNARRGGKK